MWVQLLSTQRVEKQGRLVTYRAGDWVDVGRQTAQLWIVKGEARVPEGRQSLPAEGQATIVVNGSDPLEAYLKMFEGMGVNLPVVGGPPQLYSCLNLFWEPPALLRKELIGVGFSLLDRWEMACPILSYTELASCVGSPEEREATREVIRDLRVPLYDTRLMFVRECPATRSLIGRWNAERQEGGDDRLAFLRAFYTIKPLMLALPITWTQPNAYAEVA